jgi:precorrin-6B methylase 2
MTRKRNHPRQLISGAVMSWILLCSSTHQEALSQNKKPKLDVGFVPSMEEIVEGMLKLANVTKDDVVYDLGCGDGRIVITAARKYGARGVGVDIDPERIKESRRNARNAGVEDQVKFIEQDLFKTDISKATVVTLYLKPEVNIRLRPKLLRELKPGTRVVSNSFDMGDWQADKTADVLGNPIYYWVIPEKVAPPKIN